MTYVFEAREMPFGTVTEAYAAPLQPLLASHALHDLPLWDRCMLVAVLDVMEQRQRRDRRNSSSSSTAPPHHGALQADGRHADSTVASLSSTATQTAPHNDGGDDATPESTAVAGAGPSVEDLTVALAIVRALDELEVVYDSILSTRAGWRAQQQQQGDAAAAAAPPAVVSTAVAPPKKTAEEVLLEQLLQERFSDTAPYLPESDGSADDGESSAEVADVAMCFTTAGESLGLGSASVFGGHGYHA